MLSYIAQSKYHGRKFMMERSMEQPDISEIATHGTLHQNTTR